MQIWKYTNNFVFMWKKHVEDLTLKQQKKTFRDIHTRVMWKFVYRHSETIEYAKN